MIINIVKEKRKTIQIKINEDYSVTVKAPKYVSNDIINKYISDHTDWINKSIKRQKERQTNVVYLSEEEKNSVIQAAKEYLPKMVEYYSELMNQNYSVLKIKGLKSKWGSCSKDGEIILNYKIMLAPSDVIEYVIVHELAHRKVMNHSREFYSYVEKFKPNYRDSMKYLKDNGYRIMKAFETEKK